MLIQRFTCSYNQLSNVIKSIHARNMNPILDNINERYTPRNYYNIKKSLSEHPTNFFAIKLSSLGIGTITDAKLIERLDTLCKSAVEHNSKLLIDAENYTIQDHINDISNAVITKYNNDSVNVYKTYQMYRTDTYNLLENDINAYKYLGIKLVRGAYEQEDRQYKCIHETKLATDKDYNRAIKLYFDSTYADDTGNNIIIASHNKASVDYSLQFNKINEIQKQRQILIPSNQFKFHDRVKYAQLLGMGDNLSYYLVEKNMSVYKYLPYGKFHETIPYLLRRLYENYPVAMHIFK
jgi:proline dehydrogenase